jgi:hypothetical protein
MPLCLKDSKSSYKGDEPSPKGFGYCAHCEKLGSLRFGLDGNEWIVVKNKKNIKRWIIYKRILKKNNILYKKIKAKYAGYKTYFTHFNGGRPYLVYIKNKNVVIYDVPENVMIDNQMFNENDCNWMYINLVKKYKVKEVFIGKSPLIAMTKYSSGYGKYFDGNTILLELKNKNYIYIKDEIQKIKINDKIKEYYSFIGNNDVPYPMAIGEKNIYFFAYPRGYLPLNEFDKYIHSARYSARYSAINLQKMFDTGELLSPFLIPFNGDKKGKKIMSLEEFKKIKNKPLNEITLTQMKKLAKMYNVTTSGTKKELANRIENLRRVIVYKK